jgi:hypothetical protein
MPTDNKYGKITLEKGSIPDDEPVIVFRARDKELPVLLGMYHKLCQDAGSPEKHLELIEDTARSIERWQDANPDAVKVPTSDSYEPPKDGYVRSPQGTIIGQEGQEEDDGES